MPLNKIKIQIIHGDILRLDVDAIVNPANKDLLGGGGLDGIIHSAAGDALVAECRNLGGCNTGEAKITKGYNLLARHIIHTVGPVYGKENSFEKKLLKSCYYNSLLVATKNSIASIAFPAISTGLYGYPKEEAAKIALKTVHGFLKTQNTSIKKIYFVICDHELYQLFLDLEKSIIKGEENISPLIPPLHVYSSKAVELFERKSKELPFLHRDGGKIVKIALCTIGRGKEISECMEFFFDSGPPIKFPIDYLL